MKAVQFYTVLLMFFFSAFVVIKSGHAQSNQPAPQVAASTISQAPVDQPPAQKSVWQKLLDLAWNNRMSIYAGIDALILALAPNSYSLIHKLALAVGLLKPDPAPESKPE